jgi:large conductance mechanosensitive channel
MLKEFRAFLLRGNLVVLAVAFVMGVAFAALVTAFVNDLVMPIIAAIFGKVDFSNLTFTIHHSVFSYGSFITAVIVFVSVAAAVFFFIVKPVDALTKRFDKPEAEAGPSDEERRHHELLAAIRALPH